MKIASTIARYLLGVIFLTFGLNGFLHLASNPFGGMKVQADSQRKLSQIA